MKFKVGDTVIALEDTNGITKDNEYVVAGEWGESIHLVDDDGDDRTRPADEYKLKEKTMDNLQNGDVLENADYNYDREVQGTIGKVVIVTDTDDDNAAFYAPKQLTQDGWKLKGTEPELTEVTLQEVADKLNVPVEQLRIKE